MSVTEYFESRMFRRSDGGLIRVVGALCEDGVRRTAHASSNGGHADTFFSIPAYVYVDHKRVYGFITFHTMSGSDVATDDDPFTVCFIAVRYRKHHGLIVKRES